MIIERNSEEVIIRLTCNCFNWQLKRVVSLKIPAWFFIKLLISAAFNSYSSLTSISSVKPKNDLNFL